LASAVKEQSLCANIRGGIRFGMFGAVMFSGCALLLYLVGGQKPFTQLGTSPPKLVAVYWGGCLAAGAIGGALTPLARWAAGSALIGAVVGVCLEVALRISQSGIFFWDRRDPFFMGFFAACGLIAALYFRWFPPKTAPPGADHE